MRLADITPLILTYNEAPNIGRCLERLDWASRIVVMDSGSTDETLAICKSFRTVEVVHRPFDSFAVQCNAGLERIDSEWVLSMDADYMVPANFSERLARLDEYALGYRMRFRYCVSGKPLRACLYPPRIVLYQKKYARYEDDGHGHRVQIDGDVLTVPIWIDHDDRKPLARWLDSQRKYAALEAEKLERTPRESQSWPDRLRRMIWPAAPAAFLYTLFAKRLILDGWPGFYYTLQRTYAELLLSLELLDRRLRDDESDTPP